MGNATLKQPLNIIKYRLKKYLIGECLDAGCGDCRHMKFMQNPTGIDKYEVYERSSDRILPMDLNRQLDFINERFDTILCSHVLEHLDNPDFALQEFHRVLKPNGKLVVGVPNENCIWHNFNDKRQHPGHITSWNHKKLKKALEDNNFKIISGPYTNYPLGGKLMFAMFNYAYIRYWWDDIWYVTEKELF